MCMSKPKMPKQVDPAAPPPPPEQTAEEVEFNPKIKRDAKFKGTNQLKINRSVV